MKKTKAPRSSKATRKLAPTTRYPVYRKLLKINQDLHSIRLRMDAVLDEVYDMEFENKAVRKSLEGK